MKLGEKKEWLDGISRHFTNYISCSVSVANFIACQFALESDFGQSSIARNANNFGGMKKACLRPTTAMSEYKGHADYMCVREFYDDYCFWLCWNHFTQKELSHVELFVDHLSISGYCPASSYIASIRDIYNQFYVQPINI